MTDNQAPSELDKRRKRLIFRSWHRGTKEMDIILGTFADIQVLGFTESDLEAFERILGYSDPDLYDWISGKKEPPANIRDNVFEKLMNHKVTGRG
ncbi:MAG: succinate dehydrogenase assembly factor 2 [Alphaproteobacteria bacterium]|nr:succinate dehydrogenase assembly factor 2 [Alphaproteobacteria bacterium]